MLNFFLSYFLKLNVGISAYMSPFFAETHNFFVAFNYFDNIYYI